MMGERFSYHLSLFLSAFIAGILSASFLFPPVGAVILSSITYIALSAYYRDSLLRSWPAAILLPVFLIIGYGYYNHYSAAHDRSGFWQAYYGKRISVYARVAIEPEIDFPSSAIDVELSEICLEDRCIFSEEKLRISVPSYPSYHCGDNLIISGVADKPEPSASFRYDRYLKRYGIYATMYYPGVDKQGRDGKGCLLSSWRQEIKGMIYKNVPYPEAGLLASIFLGYRKALPEGIKDDFSDSGLSHLTAISGAHIAVISGLIILLVSKICPSRTIYLLISEILAWSYVALTGATSSAIRAGIMGSLAVFIRFRDKKRAFTSVLLSAAALMLIFNPLLLRDDLGFQMSFLAMAGIGYIYPVIRTRSQRGVARIMWEGAGISLAAFISIWPLSALSFGKISPVSLISNAFVSPLFSLLLPAVAIACLVSVFFPGLSLILFSVPYALAKLIIFSSRIFPQIPGACLEAGRLSGAFVFSYYAVWLIVLFWINKKPP